MTSQSAHGWWLRAVLAGPWTLVAALIFMAAMSTWLPPGAAQVDNLMLPLLLFPVIWACLFFPACLDPSLKRAVAISVGITAINVGLLANHLL